MEKEYISIREFASRANISRQRAYQLIDKKLKSYCKTIDSKKYIDISALEEIQKGSSPDKSIDKSDKSLDNVLDKTVKPSLHQNAGPADNSCFAPLDKISQSFDTTLDKIVKSPLQQIYEDIDNSNFQHFDNAIDKIVSSFTEQLKIKDKQIEIKDNQIAKKDEQIFEMQNIIKSLQEQQVLLTKSLANSQALHAGTIQEHIESKVEKGSKKGFWSWLFGKRH